jgi:hypothetical protein
MKSFCGKANFLPINREVLPKNNNLAMKYRGFFKR